MIPGYPNLLPIRSDTTNIYLHYPILNQNSCQWQVIWKSTKDCWHHLAKWKHQLVVNTQDHRFHPEPCGEGHDHPSSQSWSSVHTGSSLMAKKSQWYNTGWVIQVKILISQWYKLAKSLLWLTFNVLLIVLFAVKIINDKITRYMSLCVFCSIIFTGITPIHWFNSL